MKDKIGHKAWKLFGTVDDSIKIKKKELELFRKIIYVSFRDMELEIIEKRKVPYSNKIFGKKVIPIKNAKKIKKILSEYNEQIYNELVETYDNVKESPSYMGVKYVGKIEFDNQHITTEEELNELNSKIDSKREEFQKEFENVMEYVKTLKNKYKKELVKSDTYKEYMEHVSEIENNYENIKKEFEKECEAKEKKILEKFDEHVEIKEFQPLYTDRDERMLSPNVTERGGKEVIEFLDPVNNNEGGSIRRGRLWKSLGLEGVFIEPELLDYDWRVRYRKKHFLVLFGNDKKIMVQKMWRGFYNCYYCMKHLKPAEIKNAEQDGRETIKYGQIYFKEMKRKDNMTALEDTKYDAIKEDDVWRITHPALDDLELEGLWKAVPGNGEIYH